MPLRQFNGYFSNHKTISSMKLVRNSCKSLFRCEIACNWRPHLGVWEHRDVERTEGLSMVKAITQRAALIVSVLMRAGIRAVSAGCHADRQQSRLFQPACIVDAWLCSSAKPCSTEEWRRLKWFSVYKTKWGQTRHEGKFIQASGVSAVTARVYFKMLFWWRDRHTLIDEKRCYCCVQEQGDKQLEAVSCQVFFIFYESEADYLSGIFKNHRTTPSHVWLKGKSGLLFKGFVALYCWIINNFQMVCSSEKCLSYHVPWSHWLSTFIILLWVSVICKNLM